MGDNKMFDWKKFEDDKIAVHCDTEEKAIDFFKKCEDKNMKWCDGDSLSNTCWEVYDEETCYICENSRIYYSYLNYSKQNRKIINWDNA